MCCKVIIWITKYNFWTIYILNIPYLLALQQHPRIRTPMYEKSSTPPFRLHMQFKNSGTVSHSNRVAGTISLLQVQQVSSNIQRGGGQTRLKLSSIDHMISGANKTKDHKSSSPHPASRGSYSLCSGTDKTSLIYPVVLSQPRENHKVSGADPHPTLRVSIYQWGRQD